jgi:beta-mannosidase
MFDSASAIFWMFNDVWPCVRSWTTVDYALRRTPAFWPVRRAMAPVTVVVTRESDAVRVYGVNEGQSVTATLRFGLLALSGSYPLDETRTVDLPANASTQLAEFDARRWDRLGVKTHLAFALLGIDGREVARDTLMLPLFREMKWPAARVEVSVSGGKAVFTSHTFAWRVCIDLDGERPLDDNFFDVYPGIPTVLEWPETLGVPRILKLGNP